MKINRILIVVLLIIGIFDLNPQRIWDNLPLPPFKPDIVIVEPSQEIIENTKEFADYITGKVDRLEVAVLANEFSKRVTGEKYSSVKFQTLNDVYIEASKLFYSQKMVDRYELFGQKMQKLLTDAAGGDVDVVLSAKEKEDISEYLRGLAWNLTR
jgi:hypothetical protein